MIWSILLLEALVECHLVMASPVALSTPPSMTGHDTVAQAKYRNLGKTLRHRFESSQASSGSGRIDDPIPSVS